MSYSSWDFVHLPQLTLCQVKSMLVLSKGGENTNPEEQRHNENEHKAESELNKTPMSDLFLLLSTEFSKVHVQCLIYQQVTIRRLLIHVADKCKLYSLKKVGRIE